MSSRRQEDLSQNRFLQVLRASFEGIYRQAAQRGDRTVILVPCAECLEAEHFGQSFVETHLLQVLFDEEKTRPLALVAPSLAAGAYGFHDGDLLWTLGAFILGFLMTSGLREVVRWYVSEIASANGRRGARFSGLKWQLGPLLPGEIETEGARGRLLSRVQALCGVTRQYLEPPFLTLYRQGDGQGQHVDSKELPNDSWSAKDFKAFEANGKQRMVQCLCYLNSVDLQHGGATVFHHEIRQKEAEAKAEKERKKAEAVAKHTGKKASQRAARRQKRLKEGKMQQTDKDLEELLQTKDEVVCAFEDVQDEAELRKKFPSEGTAGYGSEYFSSSRYKFRYLLSKDGTPVTQIYKWPWP